MSALAPILSNLLIVIVIGAFVFIASKQGFKRQLVLTLFTLAAGAGGYFLIPTIVSKIQSISSLSKWKLTLSANNAAVFDSFFTTALYLMFTIVVIAIVFAILVIVRKVLISRKYNKVLQANSADAKPATEYERVLRKQDAAYNKESQRLQLNKYSKLSVILSSVLGGVQGIVIAFILCLSFIGLTNVTTDLVFVNNLWANSLFGVIDKLAGSHIFEFIIKLIA